MLQITECAIHINDMGSITERGVLQLCDGSLYMI